MSFLIWSALLYGVEACPRFERDKHSFDFSLTHIFMKLFQTGSVDMVTECQKIFNFLPLKYQIDSEYGEFHAMFHVIRKYNLSFVCKPRRYNIKQHIQSLWWLN